MDTFPSKNLDKIFEALGNQHRREIVYALGLHPHTISSLAYQQDLSLPAIHKHIKVLENAFLIKRKKLGRTNFLTINRMTLRTMQDWIVQFQAHWGNDTDSFENYNKFLNTKSRKGGEKKK